MEIFPEYKLTDAGSYLTKRVEKVDGQEVLNLEYLYNAFQASKAKGSNEALVAISHNVQLPINLETFI